MNGLDLDMWIPQIILGGCMSISKCLSLTVLKSKEQLLFMSDDSDCSVLNTNVVRSF